MLENSIFLILAIFLIGGSLTMVWSRETIISAFGFFVAMLAMAGVFALLGNSFLFLAQIMVSVGAIVVLSMMVITAINLKEKNLPDEPNKLRWILFTAFIVTPFSLLMYRTLVLAHQNFAQIAEGYGSLKVLGGVLFKDWVLSFEIISVLLLAAMVGAVVIARKEPSDGA